MTITTLTRALADAEATFAQADTPAAQERTYGEVMAARWELRGRIRAARIAQGLPCPSEVRLPWVGR